MKVGSSTTFGTATSILGVLLAIHFIGESFAVVEESLKIKVYNEDLLLPLSSQVGYDRNQNPNGKLVEASADGESAELYGNLWRAFPLTTEGIEIGRGTYLEFDFLLEELAEVHAICIERDLRLRKEACFAVAKNQTSLSNFQIRHYTTLENNFTHYSIPVYHYFTGVAEYLVLIQDDDIDRERGISTFSNIEIVEKDIPDLKIGLDDDETMVAINNQVEYGSRQNHNIEYEVEVSSDGLSGELYGNMWRAFPLESPVNVTFGTLLEFDYELVEEADFQGICLDENTGSSSRDKRCFMVSKNQTGSSSSFYELDFTEVNSQNHYSIRLYTYFEGTMNYLALIQDNDSSDRSTGESIFSNIKIVQEDLNDLEIELYETTETIPNVQYDYYTSRVGDQDTLGEIMDISQDGKEVTMNGNMWKVMPLPTPISVTESTTLEFDFSITTITEFHAICLDEDKDKNNERRCFVLGGTQQLSSTELHAPYKTSEGESYHYVIPVGLFYTGSMNFLAFIQDNDTEDRTIGESTFSNIKIYEREAQPGLVVNVRGEPLTLTDTDSYRSSSNSAQDSPYHIVDVSEGGLKATLKGNVWRAFKFPQSVEVTASTELDFDFCLEDAQEIHAICLDDDLVRSNSNSGKVCFVTSNTDGMTGYHLEKTQEGDCVHYNVAVGLKFTGMMNYVVLIQDNDTMEDRTGGTSSFSNIALSDRAGIKIKVNGETVDIPNAPVPYGNNQDTADNHVKTSEGGTKVEMTNGNLWKAFELPTPLTITKDTILTFQFDLTVETEIHFFGLDEDLSFGNDYRMIVLAGTQGDIRNRNRPHVYWNEPYLNENESRSYAIRLSEYYNDDTMKYLVFIQDNDDRNDRTQGESAVSNIEISEAVSCLKSTNIEMSMEECTFENFVAGIENAMSSVVACGDNGILELMALFEVSLLTQLKEKVAHVCESAYLDNYLPFNQVTGEEYQFTEAYMDGDTTWNYGSGDLLKDVGRAKVVQDTVATSRGISWPKMHNFESCDLRAVTCCFTHSRQGTAADNSDACYMDYSKAPRSSHVRDGYAIYGDGAEGELFCTGFAWGNDVGYADSALKGNTLFHVAIQESLRENGRVEELPGAPMCGCVEKMPVVTSSACHKVDSVQTVNIKYDASITEWSGTVSITSISHSDCGDLSTYYQELVNEGKATPAEKAHLDEHIVGDGNCRTATSKFLETKGLKFSETSTS